MSPLLDLTQERLGWPGREDILYPKGAWPRILAESARKKIGKQIQEIEQAARDANIGILMADPSGDSTEAPFAIVCEFQRSVSEQTIRKAHKLTWNFSWSPQLIIVEPHLIRSFTCCKPPDDDEDLVNFEVASAEESHIKSLGTTPAEQAARALHWINLISGKFFRDHEDKFKRNQRADHMLLENLRNVRKALIKDGLEEGVCHDLLARVIFIQFLWDRKDSNGRAAIDERTLSGLHEKGVLSKEYQRLSDILRCKKDTYNLFLYLDEKFNGDLFAGIYDPSKSKDYNWKAEKKQVEENHLVKLADFIDGKWEARTGQGNLWKHYSFDVIPLEFISSIYEEFLTKKKKKKDKDKGKEEEKEEDKGLHFTPPHIVDFMLDGVLPWDSEEWNIKTLDPACGSAIFLVKAYQRLVHRWKNANENTKPKAADLRYLLENNIFGIDNNKQAVRIASFSLYLAMCDELDPMSVWRTVKFPNLRDKRIICSDFFDEDKIGFRSEKDAGTYDLVIGNAPWGKNTVEDGSPGDVWADTSPEGKWAIANKDIGPLFLPKSASLAKKGGKISMIMPSQALLMNISGPALAFRRKLFKTYKVEEVVNLSALRFGLFADSISPACIITLSPMPPDEESLTYICPKPTASNEDDYLVVIEQKDINYLNMAEAAEDPGIWSTLTWGGRRDYGFIRSLRGEKTLNKLLREKAIKKRLGIIRGESKKQTRDEIVNRRILKDDVYLDSDLIYLDADQLPLNEDPEIHYKDSTDFSAFESPQLIIKRSWEVGSRFQARLVKPDKKGKGILCSDSYVSVHAEKGYELELEAAFLSYNSVLAVYYLLLNSGQFSSFIPKPTMKDLLSVPIPSLQHGISKGLRSLGEIDERVHNAFIFDDVERALIEDLEDFTLPDFKGGSDSPGRQPTGRNNRGTELNSYCDYFRRVLKAGFGQDKKISATIFRESGKDLLPVRLVAFYLDSPEGDKNSIELMENDSLLGKLKSLYDKFMNMERRARPGISFRRVFRVYDVAEIEGRKSPAVYLIKPDQVRYWTRSMAMRDADEVAADIMGWQGRDAGKSS